MADEDDEPTAVKQTNRDFALKATARDLREILGSLDDEETPHSSPREHDLRAMLKQLQEDRLKNASSHKRVVTLKTGHDPEVDAVFARSREAHASRSRSSAPASPPPPSRSVSSWPTAVALLVFGGALVWVGMLLGRLPMRDAQGSNIVRLTWSVRPTNATVTIDGVEYATDGARDFECQGRVTVRAEEPRHGAEAHHLPCGVSAILQIDLTARHAEPSSKSNGP